jgi:hypothetical protein
MAHPTIKLLYNSTANDVEYTWANGGESDANFDPVITISGITCSGVIVFTGGGIEDMASGTYPSGVRSATIRPESGATVVPYTFVEYDDYMYRVPLAGCHNYRYIFAVYVGGTITSKLYLEAWDDMTHTTTTLPVLAGSASNSGISFIKAKTTTYDYPGDFWTGTALKGYGSRIELSNTSSVSDTVLYFNVFVEIPYDSVTFVNMPVLSLRYLYS